MKNTNKTLAIFLLMAVLFAGGLSLVSMQKVMAQGMSEDKPDAREQNQPDQGEDKSNPTEAEQKENAPVN